MQSPQQVCRHLAWSFVIVLAVYRAAPAADEYEITDIGTLGGTFSAGVGISNIGVVIGSSTNALGDQHIFKWILGLKVEYNMLGGGLGYPTAINDSGDFTGWVVTNDGAHGVLNETDLGIGYANDINNFGQVVGTSNTRQFIYQNGNFQYLDKPPTACGMAPMAINDSGIVAGYLVTDCASVPDLAEVIIFDDSLLLLGTMGGTSAYANDINIARQIVGYASVDSAGTDWRGFFWDQGHWTLVPTLGGHQSRLYAVNDHGIAVGDAYGTGPLQSAIIFDTIQGMRNLNDLIADTAWNLVTAIGINNLGDIVGMGQINGGTPMRAFLLTPKANRFFELKDKNGTVIANAPVTVAQVSNDPPVYSETTVATDTTDSNGQIPIPRALRNAGKWFKISTTAYQQPAVKGSALFTNLYSLHLDNVYFATAGNPSFDTTKTDSVQAVTLFHSSLAANLVVSVEWDAEVAYLTSLESGLRLASNYLFDVTDGQAYLDTVFIFDRRAQWNRADVQIFCDGEQWPEANHADRALGLGAFSAQAGQTLRLPRIFYTNNAKGNREADWTIYPYDWTRSSTSYDPDGGGPEPPYVVSYCPARTFTHELGHYLLGFRDEYNDLDGNAVWDAYNFGMMDDNLIPGDIQSSELSCAWQYATVGRQVTRQWQYRGMSCWDWFQQDVGGLHNGIWCEIAMPNEYNTPYEMNLGPNDNLQNLDYDVGSRAVFPVHHSFPFAQTKVALVLSAPLFGYPVVGAEVVIRRQESGLARNIKQGKTNSSGRLRIVGFQLFDEITSGGGYVRSSSGARAASGATSGFEWLYGEVTSSPSLDTLVVETRSVAGHYPMILRVENPTSDSVLYVAEAEVQMPGDISLEFIDHDGSNVSGVTQLIDPTFSAQYDSLGASGDFLLKARDDSGGYFTIPGAYVKEQIVPGAPFEVLFNGGGANLQLDSTAASSGLLSVALLSTPYPVIRTGLDDAFVKVSDAHAVEWSPVGPFSGHATLALHYDDDGLDPLTESTIRMFRWDLGAKSWSILGGNLDTASNELSAEITDRAVYALFTQQISTGTSDDAPSEGTLPLKFELLQNYPNPFNPSTRIEFAVPVAAHVRVEVFNVLGRSVRVLQDEVSSAGPHRVVWDGKDRAGVDVPAGVYFYQLKSGSNVLTKKMVLLR